MLNKKRISYIFSVLLFVAAFAPSAIAYPKKVSALQLPSGNEMAQAAGISAQAYVVLNVKSGQSLITYNADAPRVPASLTKLVTVMVVLDTNPNLNKEVVITQDDQTAGFCGAGGACIKADPGIGFTLEGLIYAALLPSANNAASALARSTGLSTADFVARMNAKVKSLGATGSHFNEPTGMDPNNTITASDYAKIIAATYSNPYLQKIAQTDNYQLQSTNNYGYYQTIKNTDKLLGGSDFQVLGAKTGYLDESKYNFAVLLTYPDGLELAVVVLGEDHLYTAFADTKTLAALGRNVAEGIPQSSVSEGTPTTNSSPAVEGISTTAQPVRNVSYKGTVYYVDGQSRKAYTSAGAFLSYSFNSWGTVQPATAADLALPLAPSFLPPRDGSLINDHGTVYIITNGTRAGFTSADVFNSLGYSFDNVIPGDTSFLATLPPINSALAAHPTGTVVNDGGTLYLVKAGQLQGIPSMAVFNSWGLKLNEVVPVNSYDKSAAVAGVLQARNGSQLTA